MGVVWYFLSWRGRLEKWPHEPVAVGDAWVFFFSGIRATAMTSRTSWKDHLEELGLA